MGNGTLAPSDLGYVSGHRVRADLVSQTQAMVDAAARDGVRLVITQGYRTLAEQESIFRARYTTTYLAGRPYRVWNGVRWYQRPGTAVAAVPGTSNHGWGQAIDFSTSAPGAITWLAGNGARFGWKRPDWTYKAGTVEPWHHEATLVRVSNPVGGGGGSLPTAPDLSAPDAPALLEDDDMAVIQGHGQAEVWSTNGVTKVHLRTPGQVNDMLRAARQSAVIVVGAETIATLPTYAAPTKAPTPPTAKAIADEVWNRTIGIIKGKRRTAGQGVQLAAQAATGDPVDA